MRNEVDRSNEARLRALAGEATEFRAEDWPAPEPGSNSSKNTYLTNFMATEKLVLKVGAQVMLIKNLDTTLVNGTIGKVVGFGYPDLDDDSDEENEVKMEGASDAAQARKKAKLVASVGQGKIEMAPMVEWRTPLGIERKLMVREEFKVEDMKGQKLASRKQVSFPSPMESRGPALTFLPLAVPHHSVRMIQPLSLMYADLIRRLSQRLGHVVSQLSLVGRAVADLLLPQHPQVARTDSPSRQSRSRKGL